MKVAITGGTGFLGRVVARDLARSGHDVVIFGRSKLASSISNTSYVQVNYFDAESLVKNLTGVNILIHLAGIAHTKIKEDAEKLYEESIYETTVQLYRAAQFTGVKHFIYASSIKVYGERANDCYVTENTSCHPTSLYGKEKLHAEKWLLNASTKCNPKLTIFRFPPMYGKGMRGSVKYLFMSAKLHLPLPLRGIKSKRSYLYAGNASKFITAAIDEKLTENIYLPHDLESFDTASFYAQIYRAIHGYPILSILKPKLPKIMQKLIANIEFLQPLFASFELKSIYSKNFDQLNLLQLDQAVAEIVNGMKNS